MRVLGLSLEKSGGQEEGCEMDVTGETAGVVYKKKFSISCFSVKLYNVQTLENGVENGHTMSGCFLDVFGRLKGIMQKSRYPFLGVCNA